MSKAGEKEEARWRNIFLRCVVWNGTKGCLEGATKDSWISKAGIVNFAHISSWYFILRWQDEQCASHWNHRQCKHSVRSWTLPTRQIPSPFIRFLESLPVSLYPPCVFLSSSKFFPRNSNESVWINRVAWNNHSPINGIRYRSIM